MRPENPLYGEGMLASGSIEPRPHPLSGGEAGPNSSSTTNATISKFNRHRDIPFNPLRKRLSTFTRPQFVDKSSNCIKFRVGRLRSTCLAESQNNLCLPLEAYCAVTSESSEDMLVPQVL